MPVRPAPSLHPAVDPLTDASFMEAVVAGAARLTPEQGLRLLRDMPLADLGMWADRRCREIHGDHVRTYVIDRNINYTNVCTAKCTFCAFRRDAGDSDAYTLSYDTLLRKIEELVAIGGTKPDPALDPVEVAAAAGVIGALMNYDGCVVKR
jgi:cyclic dehypoxanthinyl futalosine synthase